MKYGSLRGTTTSGDNVFMVRIYTHSIQGGTRIHGDSMLPTIDGISPGGDEQG